MNDSQLHDRLSALADDLTPGDDPYQLVTGARALHRRRRRTRIGVAGAALAVALVAVGVPTAVSSFSSPGRPDVAAPTTSSTPSPSQATPVVGDEELVQPAENLRDALLRVGTGPVPDPASDVPCPDVAEQLSIATGMFEVEPADTHPTLTVAGGCNWSTDASRDTPAIDRYDLSLAAHPELTAGQVIDAVEAQVEQDGCSFIRPLPDEEFLTLLMRCSEGEQVSWHLLVVDEDGEGFWELIAAVGTRVPESYGLFVSGLRSLWETVLDLGNPDDVAERRVDEQLRGAADALSAAGPRAIELVAPTQPPTCAAITTELGNNVVAEVSDRTLDAGADTRECTWDWTADAGPSSASLRFVRGAGEEGLGDVLTDASAAAADRHPSRGPTGFCVSRPAFDDGRQGSLEGCSLGDRLQMAFAAPDAEGTGVWVLLVNVPVDDDLPASSHLALLVALADRQW